MIQGGGGMRHANNARTHTVPVVDRSAMAAVLARFTAVSAAQNSARTAKNSYVANMVFIAINVRAHIVWIVEIMHFVSRVPHHIVLIVLKLIHVMVVVQLSVQIALPGIIASHVPHHTVLIVLKLLHVIIVIHLSVKIASPGITRITRITRITGGVKKGIKRMMAHLSHSHCQNVKKKDLYVRIVWMMKMTMMMLVMIEVTTTRTKLGSTRTKLGSSRSKRIEKCRWNCMNLIYR